MSSKIIDTLGNTELLNLYKTAFLCSREIPASIVLKCYDWAVEQREKGHCIISGFHSQIEKDVFHYLLSGTQPISRMRDVLKLLSYSVARTIH